MCAAGEQAVWVMFEIPSLCLFCSYSSCTCSIYFPGCHFIFVHRVIVILQMNVSATYILPSDHWMCFV